MSDSIDTNLEAPERPPARFFSRRAMRSPQEALHPDAAPPPPPPEPPKRRRRGGLSSFSGFLSLLMLLALAAAGVLVASQRQLDAPGPLNADRVVFIAPRTEVVDIIDQLGQAGVIDRPTLLKAALWAEGRWSSVKAGEYLFKKEASLRDVMDTLVSGRQLLHSVTIPEGLTSEQIVQRLMEVDVLTGDVREQPREGSILPETYRVPRGMTRNELIRKMQQDQNKVVDQIWARRAPNLPIHSKFELVTLASIVEKETGRADERTRVASVFQNRLNRRMRLQSDPTIVYGIVGGKGTLGRPIQRAEITKPSPYNTYVIEGLPPGPIANPGRAALEAVANPSRTKDLYFVADGTGGHVFAENLEQHNRNVARWREIERDAKAKAATGAGGAPAAGDVDRAAPLDDLTPAPAPSPVADPARKPPQRRGDLLTDPVYGGLPRLDVVAAPGSLATLSPLGADPLPDLALDEAPGAKLDAKARKALKRETPERARDKAAQAIAVALAKPAPPSLRPPAGVTAFASFKFGPTVDQLGLEFRPPGEARPNLLDGPVDMADASEPAVDLSVVPVSDKRRAEMAAKAAKFGSALSPEPLPAELQRRVMSASAVTEAAPGRRVILDASEGTERDPLLSKNWDLNAAQVIPAFR
ncbi:MAG: aminodeoxychorismate lyase [Hyphomicrobiales bacterium]|nr:aminodeoxychorismate lyase [Hyphomicrobiales bacterium]